MTSIGDTVLAKRLIGVDTINGEIPNVHALPDLGLTTINVGPDKLIANATGVAFYGATPAAQQATVPAIAAADAAGTATGASALLVAETSLLNELKASVTAIKAKLTALGLTA